MAQMGKSFSSTTAVSPSGRHSAFEAFGTLPSFAPPGLANYKIYPHVFSMRIEDGEFFKCGTATFFGLLAIADSLQQPPAMVQFSGPCQTRFSRRH